MAEEARESLEAVRLEKLRRIEALGLDPWGRRFDDHQPIGPVRELPLPPEGSRGEGVCGSYANSSVTAWAWTSSRGCFRWFSTIVSGSMPNEW